MSDHVYRSGDRVLMYGVEHVVDGTPISSMVWLRTLNGKLVVAETSLLTPVAPPEPPRPVYFEGLIPRGSLYVNEGLPTAEHVAGHAFSVSNSARIIRVKLPTRYETVFPFPETPGPQIGDEFLLERGQVTRMEVASCSGSDANEEYNGAIRVESADGTVSWKRHDSATGAA